MARSERGASAHEAIAHQLGIEIVTGQYAPGTLLPGELELAESRRVSRTVIREALRMLVAKGLIQGRRRVGTRVLPRSAWNLLDPMLLGWMFQGAPPLEFVRNLFALRLIVEPAAAALSATSRNASQLYQLDHALKEMAEFTLDTPVGQAADQRFHAIVLEATGNELIVNLSASIAAAVRWTTFFKYRSTRRPRDPIPQHRKLLDAIVNADPSAARDAAADLIRQAQVDMEASLVGRPAPAASEVADATAPLLNGYA